MRIEARAAGPLILARGALVAGSNGDELALTLGQEWQGFENLNLIFKNGSKQIEVLLRLGGEDQYPGGVVPIPWEAEAKRGYLSLTLCAVEGDAIAYTARMEEPVPVLESGAKEGEDGSVYTPDLLQQILNAGAANTRAAEEAAAAAAHAEAAAEYAESVQGASVSVGSVTTGDAGSDASVTNVGTESDAVFNFVIPRGDKGEKGATFTPEVSAQGVLSWANDGGLENPDAVNVKGPQGEPGPKGDTGGPGPQGADGVTPNVQAGTTTTLAPGSAATVTRRADSPDSAPVFDFGIPKGDAGTGDMEKSVYDPAGGEKQVAFAEELADYLPLAGGTVAGDVTADSFTTGQADGSLWLNASSDEAQRYYRLHADSSNQLYLHQYTGKETADREVLHFGPGGVGHLKNGLILGGHSSVVGTVTGVAESSKSVSSGVITDMTNMTLNVGTWVVTGGIRFEGNFVSGSNIAVNISSTARDATFDSTNAVRDGHSASTVIVRLTVIVNPTANTTYYLNCLHNCGAAKTVYGHMRAVRIA